MKRSLEFPAPPGPCSLDQLTDADRAALRALAGGRRRIVDIGTFLGGSAECLCEGMPPDGHLTTIDRFTGTPGTNTAAVTPQTMLVYALQRLNPYLGRLSLVVGESRAVASMWADGSLDLVFVDGAHDYENAKADILAWLPKLKPDGLMAGHDFDRYAKVPNVSADLIKANKTHERDPETGMHCGVIVAVGEVFSSVALTDDDSSTIWWAKPEWRRCDAE